MSCHRVPKRGRGATAAAAEINTSPSPFSLCNGLDITSLVGHYVAADNKSVLLALLSVSRAGVCAWKGAFCKWRTGLRSQFEAICPPWGGRAALHLRTSSAGRQRRQP